MAFLIRQPVQRIYHIPNQDGAVSGGPRRSGVTEMRPKSNVGPANSLHSARSGVSIQCVRATAILDPQAAPRRG